MMKNEWINVKDRLPKDDEIVLACDANWEKYYIATGDSGDWRDQEIMGIYVTHWMPLPLLPEENE